MSASYREIFGNLSNFDTKLIQKDIMRYVVSNCDGIVTEVRVNPGDVVSAGVTSICGIGNDENRNDIRAMIYVPAEVAKRVAIGMLVQLSPSSADTSQTGTLLGVVRDVAAFPASSSGIARLLGNSDIASWILNRSGGAAVEIRVDLVHDRKSKSSYLWSSIVGNPPRVTSGDVCTAQIIVEKQPPLNKAFNKLSQWLRED